MLADIRRTDVDQFYCELLYALGELARSGGTAVGAAAVAKRVAKAHGLALADWVPLPRLTREEFSAVSYERSTHQGATV